MEIARNLRPPVREELEITDVNRVYLKHDKANLVDLGRGFAWLDTGTDESLMQASQYVQTLEHRQGVRIACIEEVTLRMGFIDSEACYRLGSKLAASRYGQHVMETARPRRPLRVAS